MTATTTTTTATNVRTFAIDKMHSEVLFQVRHLVTRVRGRFNDFSGTVIFAPHSPEQSSITFTIDASSVDTSAADRDQHLRSEDFFAVEKHPTLTFVSSRVTRKSEERFDVEGTLTIRGVAKTVTLPVIYLGEAKDPWGNTRVGFETELTVNRKDFGLMWNAALETGGFLVGDDVKITVSAQAVEQ
ncbi:MAG TPA: YceI family protein [Vicinamibacterales bacterium]|nr:YceI family protein [Vicinamibacterales bacterium]